MAWSRVYLRVHWLSDVTAGVAIGTAIVLAVTLLVGWTDDRKQFSESVDG
jgi:membrane-associated phospholipid phosphatase